MPHTALGGPSGHELTLFTLDGQSGWQCACGQGGAWVNASTATEAWQDHVEEATGSRPGEPDLSALPTVPDVNMRDD